MSCTVSFSVPIEWLIPWHHLIKLREQVVHRVGVGVFIDGERGGGVRNERDYGSTLHTGTPHDVLDPAGDIHQRGMARRFDRDLGYTRHAPWYRDGRADTITFAMGEPCSVVLFVSDGLIHPGPCARRAVRRLLASAGSPPVRTVRLERLPRVLDGEGLVLFFHRKLTPSADPRITDTLEQHLQSGGRVLALHATTASFKQDERYAQCLGGRFTSHDRIGPFTLQPQVAWAEAALADVGSPAVVVDERYHHRLVDDVVVEVSAAGTPVVWSRRVGAGVLRYVAFGHRASVFRQPAVVALLTAAARRLFDREEAPL